MSENQLPDVVKRLYRLEHENRLLKRWGTVLALGVVAIVIMGQTKFNKTANVIEAEKFVLRDANGKTRATLGNFRDSMGLHLVDEKGKLRASLSIMQMGGNVPGLFLYGPNEGFGVKVFEFSGGAIILHDSNGRVFWHKNVGDK